MWTYFSKEKSFLHVVLENAKVVITQTRLAVDCKAFFQQCCRNIYENLKIKFYAVNELYQISLCRANFEPSNTILNHNLVFFGAFSSTANTAMC